MSREKTIAWLPDMDLNHDKQIQSLLCYRYTIGQTSADRVEVSTKDSRFVKPLKREDDTPGSPARSLKRAPARERNLKRPNRHRITVG